MAGPAKILAKIIIVSPIGTHDTATGPQGQGREIHEVNDHAIPVQAALRDEGGEGGDESDKGTGAGPTIRLGVPSSDASFSGSTSSTTMVRQMTRSTSALMARSASTLVNAAEDAASALVIQNLEREVRAGRSPGRDALRYLTEALVFAMLCSAIPGYSAWSTGANVRDTGALFYGANAVGQPSVYRPEVLDHLDGLDDRIDHLSIKPWDPTRRVEYGISKTEFREQPMWRSIQLQYALGLYIPASAYVWYGRVDRPWPQLARPQPTRANTAHPPPRTSPRRHLGQYFGQKGACELRSAPA